MSSDRSSKKSSSKDHEKRRSRDGRAKNKSTHESDDDGLRRMEIDAQVPSTNGVKDPVEVERLLREKALESLAARKKEANSA